MKKFNFNFKFLDRFRKSRTEDVHEEIENENDQEDVTYSDENPEEFAEKTLGGYNLDKFRAENQLLQTDNSEEDQEEQSEEYVQDDEGTDHNIVYTELEPPGKPKVARFSFKFPKFNRADSESNLRERFSNASPMKSIDKFSWNDFILKLFSPYSRAKIHGFFVILLVVTFTYLIGKSAALFMGRSAPIVTSVKSNIVMPIEKADTSLQDINRISSANLFNVKESDKTGIKKEQKDIASIVCLDAEKPTAEPLKLLDTIVLQDSVKSVASVQVRGGSELINVREGEQLNNAVEVSKINRMKIILKNLSTGDCEYVASEEEDVPLMTNMKILSPQKGKSLFKSNIPEIRNTGNNFKIKRAYRDKLVSNMSEVLTQAKAIQITNPDGSLCFKMTEVVPGSIYSNLNIQNDDVICNINGKKIENLNELMGLLGRIKEIDQFQIGLKRGGMDTNLDYGFE